MSAASPKRHVLLELWNARGVGDWTLVDSSRDAKGHSPKSHQKGGENNFRTSVAMATMLRYPVNMASSDAAYSNSSYSALFSALLLGSAAI